MGKSSIYRGVTHFRPTGRWRAQISAGGKTVSLGDHDTEQEAARAFDRAVLHKSGREGKTNFPISDYEDEIEQLQAMTQQELVALLRSRARKSGEQSSHYRGVSLLKQTGRWHAQINAGGRQVHLGFFGTEVEAARAYDRAAIAKGSGEGGGRIVTNFDLSDYAAELGVLRGIREEELVTALAEEGTRKAAMDLLAGGFTAGAASAVFGRPIASASPEEFDLEGLQLKAERALPKPPMAALAAPPASPQQQQQQQQQQQEQAGDRLPAAAQSPQPPKTPHAPPQLPTELSPAGAAVPAAGAAAIAAAAAAARAAFPGSPPFKLERSSRHSGGGSAVAAGGTSSGMSGAKRSLSYPSFEEEGVIGQAVLQLEQEQQHKSKGRKRRKVSQPARAAHA